METFVASRLYSRLAWAALAGMLVSILCGFRAPLAFIPAALCGLTGAGLFWLTTRPAIQVGERQFTVGTRCVDWREVREVNSPRFISPLLLRINLTNRRRLTVVYGGEPERIQHLLLLLRKFSSLATFDGVAHQDYWTWLSVNASAEGNGPILDQPVRMLSGEEEDEIERLYQKLKSAGKLDSRVESSNSTDED